MFRPRPKSQGPANFTTVDIPAFRSPIVPDYAWKTCCPSIHGSRPHVPFHRETRVKTTSNTKYVPSQADSRPIHQTPRLPRKMLVANFVG